MKDVTAEVEFGDVDGEVMPLTKCVCGATWDGWAGPALSIYEDDPQECPACHRRFYFQQRITVIEVDA